MQQNDSVLLHRPFTGIRVREAEYNYTPCFHHFQSFFNTSQWEKNHCFGPSHKIPIESIH